VVGKIFLAKIYFTDLSAYKIRPVLIFRQYQKEDYLFLPISSNTSLPGVIVTREHLSAGDLKRPSVVVIPKLGTIHRSLLMKELGTIKESVFQNIHSEICKSLGCLGISSTP